MNLTEARSRVELGVKWLDEHAPSDWRQKVEVQTLDMTEACRCVLGQIWTTEGELEADSDEWMGFWRVVLSDDPLVPHLTRVEARKLGFDASSEEQFEDLREIWIEVLDGA